MITVAGHTFEETLLKDGVIIDVGCRGFEFSEHFITLRKKVYAIDPDETIFVHAKICEGYGLNFLNIAISDRSGETTYYPNGEATMIRQFDPDPTFEHIDKKYSKTCKVITMEELYRITGENVDILKLDCEGAEYAILGETFRPIPRQISVEFHHHCVPALHKEKYSGIIERLSQHYIMHNAVWEQRHGCGYNFWDTLFIRKDLQS